MFNMKILKHHKGTKTNENLPKVRLLMNGGLPLSRFWVYEVFLVHDDLHLSSYGT